MFIEDEELRLLYQVSSAEHIQAIELGLLRLEQSPPDDRDILKVLLREAHSLKGDSRMLGVQAVETVIHQMEDILSAIEQGTQTVSPPLCDRLYHGLDAVRQLAQEATTGEPSGVSPFHVIAQLMGAMELAEESVEAIAPNLVAPKNEPKAIATPAEAIPAAEEQPDSESRTPDGTIAIQTLRVESTQLDTLMTQADELSVTKRLIARRSEDLAELTALWEDWIRDLQNQLRLPSARGMQTKIQSAETLQQIQQETEQRLARLGQLIQQIRGQAIEDNARLESVAHDLENGIRNLRMLPLSSIFTLFPRLVRDLARQQNKSIQFVVAGEEVLADKRILEEIKDPLIHLLRNAIDHGIETPTARQAANKPETAILKLRGYRSGSQLLLEVSDDGRGLDLEAIRQTALRRQLYTEAELAQFSTEQLQALIFAPGFSTRSTVTEISGRGIGMDVVRANIERLKGSIRIESTPGHGCTFHIALSLNLAAAHVILVDVGQTPYAIPIEAIETLQLVPREAIFPLEGSLTIHWEGQPISVVWLSDLLNLPVESPNTAPVLEAMGKAIPCVMLRVGSERLGLLVDRLLDEQHIIIKPHSKLLNRVPNLIGSAILGNGEVCMVLNPPDLIQSAGSSVPMPAPRRWVEPAKAKPKILLVEDSVPIRTQVKRILEGAGYAVTAAVDGLDGFNQLKNGSFDALVSDVEMPNWTGLELTRQIRACPEYAALPIVLVTTLAKEEDKCRGTDAGANAYLTKGDFDQSLLLSTLRSLI